MRLGVYTDYAYTRADQRTYAQRAFALFVFRLADECERLVVFGKIEPEPAVSHYPVPESVRFAELPYFADTTRPYASARAMAASVRVFWRALAELDAVWLLGPHPLALVFAVVALARGRRVTLGVRQDFPSYVRSRHPGRRWVHLTGDLLERAWQGLARVLPTVVVGPGLARTYSSGRTLEMMVSLVRADDLRSADGPPLDYGAGELRMLSVGRLEKEKNPLLLADILAELRAREPRWTLVVCGEGPMHGELADRLERLGVADHARLLGYVSHSDGLAELYRSSHVLLHVSWTEGLPQILFEAFAARLPVVATAVGGIPAAVGNAASLIEPGSRDQAVEAVIEVAGQPEMRARLIAAGVKLATTHTLDAEILRLAAFLSTAQPRA